MKTFFKVVGLVLLVVVALAAIGVAYLSLRKPAQRPASTEAVEATPARIARGRYLVHHVSICTDCHSERTLAYALPFKPDRVGVGGFTWNEDLHFPGTLAAANLTPDPETGLGKWTDGEIMRAIREGVDREGKALFPLMPYGHFRHMSDEDVASIVAYLRTLQPQRWERPEKKLDVPLNFVEKFIPAPLPGPVPQPDRNDRVAYGKYLVEIASCNDCHVTKDENERPLEGMDFAGGWEMHGPGFRVVASNITPHPDTWMGKATKEEFIGRFRAFAAFTPETAPAATNGRNTLMPWISYSGMTDEDLGAMYDYLKTVKPIQHAVQSFPDSK